MVVVAALVEEGIERRIARILGFATFSLRLLVNDKKLAKRITTMRVLFLLFGAEISWTRKIQSLSKCIGMPHFCGTQKPGQPYGDPSYDLRTHSWKRLQEQSKTIDLSPSLNYLKHQNRISNNYKAKNWSFID